MRGGTLFSGIAAPEVAMPWVDWRWCAEIDPFASAVLKHHYPHIRNLGDVNDIDAGAVEPVDIVVFGSPCQSWSVAGKRLGLDDQRGNLALVALRLISRIRPKWMVFENVPGLLSSNGGRDFGAFLGLLGECGYGFAYRIFDAQHAGVPQRRRRVFVVGYLGDWRPPAAVLFEQESLCWNPPPRRAERQRTSPTTEAGANRTGGTSPPRTTVDTADSLIAGSFEQNSMAGRGTLGWSAGDRPLRPVKPQGDHQFLCFDARQSDVCVYGDRAAPLDNCSSTVDPGPVAPAMGVNAGRGHGAGISVACGGNRTSGPIDVATAVNAHGGPHGRLDFESETFVTHTLRADGFDASEICSVDGCEKPRHASGMCKSHYARLKRHGDPLAGRVNEGEPLRFLMGHVGFDGEDCVLWPYAELSGGYGSVEHQGKTVRVNRLMCEMAHGPAPFPELDAAHSCGVRLCINPGHLRWASRADNMADTIAHGTAPRGERHGAHKLVENDVLEIRERLSSGETHEAIAAAYRVSRNTITDIAKGKNWAWLREDGTGRGTPLVAVPVDLRQSSRGAKVTNNRKQGSGGPPGTGVGVDGDPAYTVSERGQAVVTPLVAVAFHENQRAEVTLNETAGSLKVGGGKPGQGYPALQQGMSVRRLSPIECARLQGFPDHWLDIVYRGKLAVDGNKYRALGNSMAVPVVRWLGHRIRLFEQVTAQPSAKGRAA